MKVLIRYLAYVLIISAFFRIIPAVAALIYGESTLSFIITFLVSIALGYGLIFFSKRMKGKEETLSLTKGLMLVALSFIILPLIGSISFLPSFNYNILNAVFESISGFTTTGLTLYPSLGGLPKSLLLWRAETQWIGGIGIIMVFLFIFSRLKSHTYTSIPETESKAVTATNLYQAQGFPERLEPGLKRTAENVILIYAAYTAIGVALLLAAGMPLLESIAMCFTSLSTGGFVIGEQFYTNNYQLIVLSALMLIGSISFIAHNRLLQKDIKRFLSAFEKNIFFIMLGIAAVLAYMVYPDFKVALFQLISSFTTTGYSIAEISLLPQFFIMLIMLGMIIGGNIASTAGGIKVFRFYYVLKSIPWLLKKLSSPPNAVIPLRVRQREVSESTIIMIEIFVLLYFFILFLGTGIFMLFGYNFLDSSFQVTSALGTVGLQTMPLLSLNWVCKIVLMFAMLLGRLEIFPLLVLARNVIRKWD